MNLQKIFALSLIVVCCNAYSQEESATDWNARYQALIKSDPSVLRKVDSGQVTKQEIIDWLKSMEKGGGWKAEKPQKTDWDAAYESFLKSNPKVRSKLASGETSKIEIIEYLELESGEKSGKEKWDGDKKEWDGGTKGKGSGSRNARYKGYRSLVEGSKKREYILHVPASYDKTKPTPLVINFHGFGGRASDYAEEVGVRFDLNEIADENGFLVAYPQAAFREKGANYWEPGDTGRQDIEANDVYFTKQLIADIGDELNLDKTRIYAVGYSNGGMMAYDLACCASDSIAAVGIMSGIMLSDTCYEKEAHTSVIHFHGVSDGVLPYEGDENYKSVSSVIELWVDHNGIPASNRVTTKMKDGDVVRETYRGGKEDTSVVLYSVKREYRQPGGHVWFSEPIEGKHPNQILWDFLSSNRLKKED
jgi:polyhydroxybutyrate depolymerase